MRAQSSGEWPGSSVTWRLGRAGLDECVGGGARPEDAGTREEPGGGRRLGAGPRARCAELAAGNWPSVGGRGAGRGGGGIIALAAGGDVSSDSEKVGGGADVDEGCVAFALGVVGESGSWI